MNILCTHWLHTQCGVWCCLFVVQPWTHTTFAQCCFSAASLLCLSTFCRSTCHWLLSITVMILCLCPLSRILLLIVYCAIERICCFWWWWVTENQHMLLLQTEELTPVQSALWRPQQYGQQSVTPSKQHVQHNGLFIRLPLACDQWEMFSP